MRKGHSCPVWLQIQQQDLMSLPDGGPVARDASGHAARCSLVAEALYTSGVVRLRVTGRSMLPSVWPGDTLLVRRRGAEQLARGDILLFHRNERLFAHRIVSEPGGARAHVLVKGDGLPDADAPVSPDEVLGIVCRILRGGTWVEPRSRLEPFERLVAILLRRTPRLGSVAIRLQQIRAARDAGGRVP
jgi:hypothetical protein